MNPYLIAGALGVLVASNAATGWFMYGAGQDSEIAKKAELDKVRQETRELAQQGAADAIVKAQKDITKVVTRIQTVTREVPVYQSAECSHDDRVFYDLNSALRGEPAGEGLVPKGSGGATEQDAGGDR